MKKDQLVKLLSSWGEKEADLKKKAVKVLKEEALKKLQEQKEKGQGKEERGKEEEQEEPPSKKQKIEDDKKEEGKKEIQQPAALTEAAEEGGHHWHKLSDDCIVNIFRMLPSGEEAAKVASVCSKWNSLLKNDKLWEGFYMKRWGGEVHPQRLEVLCIAKLTDNNIRNSRKRLHLVKLPGRTSMHNRVSGIRKTEKRRPLI